MIFCCHERYRHTSRISTRFEFHCGRSSPSQKDILVNGLTGEILDQQKLNRSSYSDVQLLVEDLRNDGKYEAIAVAQRKTKQIKLHVVSMNVAQTQLAIKDHLALQNIYIIPNQTQTQAKTISLRNQLGEELVQVNVKRHYHLVAIAAAADSSTRLALGDDHYSTSIPQPSYIYLCQVMQGGGGAQKDGSWIHDTQWDYSEKNVTVDGAVSWSNGAITVTSDGTDRTITGNGLPGEHTTGEFPIATTDDAYEYDHNPNSIGAQSYNLTLPANPTEADSPSCVGGELGIALSGVAIFNGLDALNRDAGAHEIQDDFGGHPEITSMYHYHTIDDGVADLSTAVNGMKLVGFAFDGFGMYDETEYGKTLRTEDLDECHGHSHEITWDGETVTMYYYHATKDYQYTVGCFQGTPALSEL